MAAAAPFPYSDTASLVRHAQAMRIESGLSARLVRLAQVDPHTLDLTHVVVVESGEASLVLADGIQELQPPSVCILRLKEHASLSLQAGAAAHVISCSRELLIDAIGDEAESYSLRIVTDKLHLKNDASRAMLRKLLPLLAGFEAELDEGRRSWMVLSAYMRLVLVLIYRSIGAEEQEGPVSGQTASSLQRFRKLVEMHFREQHPVGFYAELLGVTHDRLHAICTRQLGRPPVALLHDRVIHEAKLRLERSSGTIQQIAASLGFMDPTYFSHFFKRKSGLSPAKYRALAAANKMPTAVPLSSGYSDWP